MSGGCGSREAAFLFATQPFGRKKLYEQVVIDIRNMFKVQPQPQKDSTRINEKIRAHEVRLIGPDGKQLGVMSPDRAMEIAVQNDMDLVEIAPQAKPPVCRIMDYGKFKYEKTRKAREARRNQRQTTLKEVKFRPKIDVHDFEVKVRRIEKFIAHGDKVKITVMFRGRERSHSELGYKITERVKEAVETYAFVEVPARMEGRNMHMMLAPLKKEVQQAMLKKAAASAAEVENDSDKADD